MELGFDVVKAIQIDLKGVHICCKSSFLIEGLANFGVQIGMSSKKALEPMFPKWAEEFQLLNKPWTIG